MLVSPDFLIMTVNKFNVTLKLSLLMAAHSDKLRSPWWQQ